MVQEAFLQQMKVYPPAVRGLPSAVLLYGVLCTGGGGDCLLLVQGIRYLLQPGWYQKGHRLLDFYVFF